MPGYLKGEGRSPSRDNMARSLLIKLVVYLIRKQDSAIGCDERKKLALSKGKTRKTSSKLRVILQNQHRQEKTKGENGLERVISSLGTVIRKG